MGSVRASKTRRPDPGTTDMSSTPFLPDRSSSLIDILYVL